AVLCVAVAVDVNAVLPLADDRRALDIAGHRAGVDGCDNRRARCRDANGVSREGLRRATREVRIRRIGVAVAITDVEEDIAVLVRQVLDGYRAVGLAQAEV